MPTWAAVTVALSGAVLGAISGGFAAYLTLRATQVNVRHREREEWKSRVLDVLEGFVDAYTRAWILVDDVLTAHEDDVTEWIQNAWAARDEAQKLGIRLGLVVGHATAIDAAAETMLSEVTEAIQVLQDGDRQASYKALDRAGDAQAAMLNAANERLKWPG